MPAGTRDLERTVCTVTLVPHLNAKLISRVWDFFFFFFACFFLFFLFSRSLQEQEMKYPSRIPFHLRVCCSDDKVSPLEFYLISKDEKELKASPGGWVHLTLAGILRMADA